MGWRVSWYKADKEKPLIVKTDKEGYEDISINGIQIANNQGTDMWIKLRGSEEYAKEIKCLREDPDRDFYSITKEGFKQIILFYRQVVIDYMKASVEVFEKPELKEISKYWNAQDLLEMVKHEIREWEACYKNDDGSIHYFNIDFEKDNLVSGSWLYKFAIYDMIYIYKTFDWDKYTMVVYGG